jgi:hypothetical protein
VLGGIGFFIYSVVVKKRAFGELVTFIEKAKPKLTNGDKEELFGNKNNPDSAESIQSPATKKMVATVRDKMPREVKI